MKWIKKTWNYFNGKKTTISMIAILAVKGVTAFLPNALTPDQANVLTDIALLFGGLGVIHKGTKEIKINQAIKTATNNK